MARIKIRIDTDYERVVGLDPCTGLRVSLVAGSDFPTPELRADAYYRHGDKPIHLGWDFPRLRPKSRIELCLEPGAGFDPPDRSDGKFESDLLADERVELETKVNVLESALEHLESLSSQGNRGQSKWYCSFCGRGEGEVNHLMSGPSVFICDGCIEECNRILSEKKR